MISKPSIYTEQAEQFLMKHGLEFRAVLVGSDCPAFCEDAAKDRDMDKLETYPRKSHIHGKHYRCTISGKDRGHVSFDFWNSYSDEEFNHVRKNSDGYSFDYLDKVLGRKGYYEGALGMTSLKHKPRLPQAYDLLTAITKNDPGTFENFVSEYSYDSDSRKAEEVYRAVVKEYAKVRKFFTVAELEELQEIQ